MTFNKTDLDLFEGQLNAWGIYVGESKIRQLSRFIDLLSSYEEANLVGTKEFSRLLLEHVLDSLSCLLYEPLTSAGEVVDVGSGGGLPGIPLKITMPATSMTLVEATGKKARFLRRAIEELELAKTRVVNARAEDMGKDLSHRARYDAATARALAPLPTLVEYCVPLLRPGGCLVAMKGDLKKEELGSGRRASAELGAEVAESMEVDFIPELSVEKKSLAIITKVSETPSNYPRRPGVPKKKPLGTR